MTKEEVIALMASCGSEEEWNACCRYVRKQCGGFYPEFWLEVVYESNLYADTFATWDQNLRRTIQ